MCGPLLSSALLSRGKIALGRLSTLFALYYLLEVILHCEECFGDWAAPGFPRAAACMIKKCASIFHSITGKTLSFGIFSQIKYYARAVWSHLHQSSGHFFVNHGNFDDDKWRYYNFYSTAFFFIGLYAKAELNSLCRFTFESRLVSPAGTKVSAAHAATCLGLPLLRRMFGVFFARGNERSSSWRHLCRARAAHTVLRGSTRPPHGTRLDLSPRRRLLIHTAWKWGWRVWGGGEFFRNVLLPSLWLSFLSESDSYTSTES